MTPRDPSSSSSEPTLADSGEFGFLDQLLPLLRAGDRVDLGAGDDAAVFGVDGQAVISTDALVEGIHFKRDWSRPDDVGRKAVAVNVSDIEAMGALPRIAVIALSAPATTPVSWLRGFFDGAQAEAEKAGVAVVGGDITAAHDITIAVTVVGETAGVAPVTRSGAQPGDVVALRGTTGWAAAGLAVLSRGFRSPRAVVDVQRTPHPPYGQGRVAAKAGATAMIDVSDGLLADLGHVAERSGVAIDIDSGVFDVPEPLRAVAAATGSDALGFVLTGAEDHALAATFPAGSVPDGWLVIGEVMAGEPAVTVDGREWVESEAGFDHFRH